VTFSTSIGLVALASLVAVGCSSGDDAAPPSAVAATAAAVTTVEASSTMAPDTSATTGSTSPVTTTDVPTTPTTAVAPSTGAPSTSDGGTAPTTTDPSTTEPTTTAIDIDAYDRLAAVLPDAVELDLPADWVTRQLDPTVVLDDDLIIDFDPFLGLVTCDDGVLREGTDVAWVERSIVGPALPLDDGLLGVRATIERESEEQSAADAAAVVRCVPTGAQVLIEPSEITIDVAGRSVDAQQLRVSSSPTEDVPFPGSFSYVVAHDGDTTATVLLHGLDMGQDWTTRTADIVARILERAD